MIKSDLAKGNPTLVVDAGNWGDNKEFSPWDKTQFIWDMMGEMKYDAVTPGDAELVQGVDALKKLLATQPQVKVVSANVMDKSGKHVFPETVVIDKGGVRFGVTGTTGGSYYNFNVTRGLQTKDDFTFEDSKAALQRVLPGLRAKCDILVVLMHEGPGDAKRIVDELTGMDVVVVGHNPSYQFNPDRVGQTLVIRPGNRGQYLCSLELTLGADGKIADYNGEGKPLGETVEKDPALDKIITKWETDFNARKTAETRKSAAKAAVNQGTEKYVGSEMCARCHSDIFAKWSQTPHARAWDTLVKDKKQNQKDCVECHVTGWGEPTGYEQAAATEAGKDAAKDAVKTDMRNVQCESCHGMGTFHGTTAMLKKPTEDICMNCHTGEFGKNFNYATAIAKVH
jgi:predicted CXXCH cytochrome family protein